MYRAFLFAIVNYMSHLLVHLLNIHEHSQYAILLDSGQILHLRKLLAISGILMCKAIKNMFKLK